MATQLKNLKFGDYTLKGETNLSGGMNYKLGDSDTLTYEYTYEGVTQEEPIIDLSWSLGCSIVWHFHGGADYAGFASEAGAVGSTSGSALYYDGDRWVLNVETTSVGSSGGSALYYDTNDGRWVLNAKAPSVGSSGGDVLYYDSDLGGWVFNAPVYSVGSANGSALYYDGGRWILNALAYSVGSANGSALYYDGNSWILNAPVYSVGSANGSALYYDGYNSVWKFEGVADKALGFMTTGGSANYMLFTDYLDVPGINWQSGGTATLAQIQEWIEGFMANLNGDYLAKVVM